MVWIDRRRNFLRFTILTLLIASLLGPWAYDRIHVPGEYICDPPFIRLDGDFCGSPMSWLSIFSWFTDGFFLTVRHLITGSFAVQARELLAVLIVVLPLLPFFSTLLLLTSEHGHRLRAFHLIAWGLGCLLPLIILLFEWNRRILGLWGAWLYILLACGAFLVEILGRKAENRPVDAAL